MGTIRSVQAIKLSGEDLSLFDCEGNFSIRLDLFTDILSEEH